MESALWVLILSMTNLLYSFFFFTLVCVYLCVSLLLPQALSLPHSVLDTKKNIHALFLWRFNNWLGHVIPIISMYIHLKNFLVILSILCKYCVNLQCLMQYTKFTYVFEVLICRFMCTMISKIVSGICILYQFKDCLSFECFTFYQKHINYDVWFWTWTWISPSLLWSWFWSHLSLNYWLWV